jgi:hypothetical protein
MKAQKTYRELLLDTIVTIENHLNNLLVLGMEMVMFEDRKAGLVPFEDGDEIPVYIDVFEASDIPAVQTIAHVVMLFQEICLSLRNINNFTAEEIDDRYPASGESQEPDNEMSTDKDLSFEDFKSQAYVCLSDTMYLCNSNAYWMIYGEEADDELHHDFYFPDAETYALLSADDANIRLLIDLTRYLESHRDLVWNDH